MGARVDFVGFPKAMKALSMAVCDLQLQVQVSLKDVLVRLCAP